MMTPDLMRKEVVGTQTASFSTNLQCTVTVLGMLKSVS